MLILPADLQAAIARALAAAPAARWLRAAQALSARYRAPGADGKRAPASSAEEWLGYAALIMPATYAQLRGAMAAAAARVPGWAPATVLDMGSGPGTALWAAAAQWPTVRTLTAWEREPEAIALGRSLARGSEAAVVRAAQWERLDLRALNQTNNVPTFQRSNVSTVQRYDLVVLGHVLNELDIVAWRAVVGAAWRQAGGLLLIVEPGTPEGFAVVRAARDALLAEGARTIAPCAHDRPCPLENDWCHFPQRLKRPDFQRRARGAPSEWEDSKFAYAALARFLPEAPVWGRVIREPFSNKAYAEVKISSVEGVARYRALKRHRDVFRLVKHLRWGAALSEPPPESIIPTDRESWLLNHEGHEGE
jgi:ribosomal protein RSM22 (predicted rRNA methylase)